MYESISSQPYHIIEFEFPQRIQRIAQRKVHPTLTNFKLYHKILFTYTSTFFIEKESNFELEGLISLEPQLRKGFC